MRTYAKVNFAIRIPGRAENGYHLINSFMQLIDLYDEVDVSYIPGEPSPDGKILAERDAREYGEKNLCIIAAKKTLAYLGQENLAPCFRIALRKNIPTAAGLGGGSADAAVTVLEILRLLDVELPFTDLMELGLNIGSDVPFLLAAHLPDFGTAGEISGIGEQVIKRDPLPGAILLKRLPIAVSTKAVYQEFDRLNPQNIALSPEARPLTDSDLFTNDLTSPAVSLFPQIAAELDDLKKRFPDQPVFMSGSGPSLCAYFADDNIAAQITTLDNEAVVMLRG
jgi:4-diphosphocytidyl-2-C-methyl-D-erythritol kinase